MDLYTCDEDFNYINFKLVSFYDIVKWFNEKYPPDLFVKHPIAQVRELLNAIVRGEVPKKDDEKHE